MESGKIAAVLFVVVSVLFLVIFGPFLTIWSLNTLFGLEIEFTFKTWAAVIWIMTVLNGVKISLKRQN